MHIKTNEHKLRAFITNVKSYIQRDKFCKITFDPNYTVCHHFTDRQRPKKSDTFDSELKTKGAKLPLQATQ